MNKKLTRTIEIAHCLKPQKQSGRAFHVCSAWNKNKMVALTWNSYEHGHLAHKFGEYKPTRGGNNYRPCRHAEAQAIKKLRGQTKDLTFCVVRIDNNGKPALSRPCKNCAALLDKHGFKSILYTIDERTFGTIK